MLFFLKNVILATEVYVNYYITCVLHKMETVTELNIYIGYDVTVNSSNNANWTVQCML